MNILVTCGGGLQGLTVYKHLSPIMSAHKIISHVWDVNHENIGRYFFHHYHQSPAVSNRSEYELQLYEYCKQYHIRFIVPATAYDLEILASLKTKFHVELHCAIIVCDSKYVNIFTDKLRTQDFLLHNGFATLPLVNVSNASHYPVIAKPRTGWGGKGVKIFYSKAEMMAAEITNVDAYLWQPLIPDFKEFSIDFSVDTTGRISEPVVRKREATSAGFAVVTQSVNNPPTEITSELQKIKKIFGRAEFSGLYNIQILQTKQEAYITDINPRIGTSAVMNTTEDKNLLQPFFSAARNIAPVLQPSSKVVRYLEELYLPHADTANIKALVFDLDDTLVSNKDFIIARCELLFQRETNVFNTDHSTFINTVIGLLNEGKAAKLIDCICAHFGAEAHQYKILNTYRTCFPSTLSVYPDVAFTLQTLHSRGYRLFILTDNPLRTQQIKINLFPLRSYIEKVYYTAASNKQKPHPQCFKNIAEEHQLQMNQLVMIGDNQYRDILGALDAGYSYAFHITRPDNMVTSLPSTFRNSTHKHRIISLNNLQLLLQYFS